jgi:uncharacterized membrane protein YoaK (UPF0700 family)
MRNHAIGDVIATGEPRNTMNPINQRIGKVAQILMIPLVAFNLGRMSVEPFSGSGWAWASVILSVVLLLLLLAPAVALAWMPKD